MKNRGKVLGIAKRDLKAGEEFQIPISLMNGELLPNDSINSEVKSLIPEIEDNYYFIGQFPTTVYSKAYYSYLAVYYNLSTSYGWYPQSASQEYLDKISSLDRNFKEKNCQDLKNDADYLKIRSFISYKENCDVLDECNFRQKIKKDNVCLYIND